MISSNSNILVRLLPNLQTFSDSCHSKLILLENFAQIMEILFRVHIFQSYYYKILYTFQSSYKPTLIFSESYYQTIHTYKSSYIPIMILCYDSYYPNCIYFSLTNRDFFILNKINIVKLTENYYQIILTFSELCQTINIIR